MAVALRQLNSFMDAQKRAIKFLMFFQAFPVFYKDSKHIKEVLSLIEIVIRKFFQYHFIGIEAY